MSNVSERLLAYSRMSSIPSSEQTLARIAARWLRLEPDAADDPLLTDLWSSVRLAEGSAPLHSSYTPFPSFSRTKPRSIVDYFAVDSIHTPTVPSISIVDSKQTPHLTVYCDGACKSNGRRGAHAGYGVSVWSDETGISPRREIAAIARPLENTEPQTNQRAELRGLAEALQIVVDRGCSADIYSDSQYAINCIQTWGAGWEAKGWRKADGSPVLHQDILKPLWNLWKHRGPHIHLHHVAAHTGGNDVHSRGNARADHLATKSIAAE